MTSELSFLFYSINEDEGEKEFIDQIKRNELKRARQKLWKEQGEIKIEQRKLMEKEKEKEYDTLIKLKTRGLKEKIENETRITKYLTYLLTKKWILTHLKVASFIHVDPEFESFYLIRKSHQKTNQRAENILCFPIFLSDSAVKFTFTNRIFIRKLLSAFGIHADSYFFLISSIGEEYHSISLETMKYFSVVPYSHKHYGKILFTLTEEGKYLILQIIDDIITKSNIMSDGGEQLTSGFTIKLLENIKFCTELPINWLERDFLKTSLTNVISTPSMKKIQEKLLKIADSIYVDTFFIDIAKKEK